MNTRQRCVAEDAELLTIPGVDMKNALPFSW